MNGKRVYAEAALDSKIRMGFSGAVDLNREALELAARIQENFEELGV